MTFEDLKEISLLEFAELGKEEIGYIKPTETDEDGVQKFQIVGADGRAMAEVDDIETAWAAMEHFELETATLH
ncbi:hypothetical protein [Curvivirga sp.]|uniref:hypothetical protein n=1 Tax=Curvivirga sp. TaxID=2856848 RepID=UPI003B5CCA30